MMLIAFGVWLVSWFQITNCALFAERVAFKLKIDYFKSCLEKDAAYYDEHDPTEMTSRISKEVSAIQRGIGEKFGGIIFSVSGFITGYIFAFMWGWILSLILFGGFPVMICTGAVLGISVQGGVLE